MNLKQYSHKPIITQCSVSSLSCQLIFSINLFCTLIFTINTTSVIIYCYSREWLWEKDISIAASGINWCCVNNFIEIDLLFFPALSLSLSLYIKHCCVCVCYGKLKVVLELFREDVSGLLFFLSCPLSLQFSFNHVLFDGYVFCGTKGNGTEISPNQCHSSRRAAAGY